MTKPKEEKFEDNPTEALQAAIQKLEAFTEPEAGGLEVHENGSLIARKGKPLERVIGLAKHFIAPIFSDHARQEREKKLSLIKEEILKARDVIQSHSSLIDKLKNGDPNQQKLAESALNAIKRYNSVVKLDHSLWTTKYDFYNFERNQILLDQEIKGQPIELPHVVSIRFESHTANHPAQKSLRELSETFLDKPSSKGCANLSPTYKKSTQFMLDTFRMKAVRMIQQHLLQHHSVGEIINLVKQTPIDISESSTDSGELFMRQVLEELPGSRIVLTGSFTRPAVDSKFMSMPILVDFHLASHLEHAGFPYPSQHTGWALSQKLVESFPLRVDQVPLFQQIDQRRKRLAQALLFDHASIQKSRLIYKSKREIFDQDREFFLKLHQELQEAIILASEFEIQDFSEILNNFYEMIKNAPATFDILNSTQQKLNHLMIHEPAKKLQEEWLEVPGSYLRKGNPQEKLLQAIHLLEEERSKALAALNLEQPLDAYIHLMGNIIGRASQRIILQYFSEKIGFGPPMLNDFEQKIQTCAFQQLVDFLDGFEKSEMLSPLKMKEEMTVFYKNEIHLFQIESIEELHQIPAKIVQELEFYFPTRFFAKYPRKSYLPSVT
jgi:hypothetical protein